MGYAQYFAAVAAEINKPNTQRRFQLGRTDRFQVLVAVRAYRSLALRLTNFDFMRFHLLLPVETPLAVYAPPGEIFPWPESLRNTGRRGQLLYPRWQQMMSPTQFHVPVLGSQSEDMIEKSLYGHTNHAFIMVISFIATIGGFLFIFDRVGVGHSFASGLICGFMTTDGAEKAVNHSAVHGALAMTTPGDTTMATLTEVEGFMKSGSARVKR